MASRAPRNLLVIGRAAYVDGLFPDDRTQLFDTSGFDNVRSPHLPGLKALGEAIGGNQFDLILCEANHRPPWSMNALSRLLFSRKTLQGRASLMPNFGQQLLRRRTSIPIGIIDHEDRPTIEAADLYLLSRCRFYFKREMPTDSWKLFMNTAAVGLPSLRFRAAARHRAWHPPLAWFQPDGSDAQALQCTLDGADGELVCPTVCVYTLFGQTQLDTTCSCARPRCEHATALLLRVR